jgi:hypothetical protein
MAVLGQILTIAVLRYAPVSPSKKFVDLVPPSKPIPSYGLAFNINIKLPKGVINKNKN